MEANTLNGKATSLTGSKMWQFVIVGLIATLGLIISIFLAIAYGAKEMSLQTVWLSIVDYQPDKTLHQIIHEIRLPRVIAAAVVGAAFAVAGALMQGVTRNPLADAGVLGINAGAAFMLALSFAFFPNLPYFIVILLSFVGAVGSTISIYLLGSASANGLTPVRLTIAGAVVAALLSSLSAGIAIYFDLAQDLAFWYAGGAAGIHWSHLKWLVSIILTTIIAVMGISRSVSLLSMDEEVAINLGVKTKRVQLLAMAAVVVLAGVSVSVAGSIGFVGLIIPHIARKLVGTDYRFIIPLSAILGAELLVLADWAARTINPPQELALGVTVALLGVPFFLYLARKERGR
ncbi:iron complex transport system permease protein [Brevibacillus fulvus]|uniref:Iron complex transport system permease protein n=2 Tax=Brevibacillus fulvus TaxID=1125967 RepID=A0A938XZ50_9BACL|nr:iron complex transport system permease protein [Brevibacillus fulvus]